jgi:hypothetical protein
VIATAVRLRPAQGKGVVLKFWAMGREGEVVPR